MNPQSSQPQIAVDWRCELESNREWMRQIALLRLGDADAADDVVQDASLAVIRQDARPNDPEKVRPWLYQIVVRRIADMLRRRYRQRDLINGYARSGAAERDGADGQEWILLEQQRKQLGVALKHLPGEDQRILLLKYHENWTYQQIGEELGVSQRAVEYRLVRAKQHLRSQVQSHEPQSHKHKQGGEES